MSSTNVGDAIRKVRLERGLTQALLGKMAGITASVVSRIEMGRIGLRQEAGQNLARALRVPVFRLFMTDKEWAKWSGKK